MLVFVFIFTALTLQAQPEKEEGGVVTSTSITELRSYLDEVFSEHDQREKTTRKAHEGNSLLDYYDESIQYNEDLSIAFQDYMMAIDREKASLASKRSPVFSWNIGLNAYYNNASQELMTTSAGLGVFYPLYDLSKKFAYESALVNTQARQLQKEAQQQLFVYQFLDTFLSLSEVKSRYYFAREQANFLEDFYERIKDEEYQTELEKFLAENPNNTEEDFVFNERFSGNLRDTRRSIEALLRTVQTRLDAFYDKKDEIEALYLEKDMPVFYLLHPYQTKDLTNELLLSLQERVRRHNFNIKISKTGVSLSEIAIEEALGAKKPRIGLVGSLGVGADSRSDNDDFFDASAGIALSWTWSDGGVRDHNIDAAQKERTKSALQLKKIQENLEVSVKSLHRKLNTQYSQVKELVESYAESKEFLDLYLGEPVEEALQDPEQEIIEPVGIFEKRAIVLGHFRLAEELVLAQHSYLKTYLQLELLAGDLNRKDVEFVSDLKNGLIVDCDGFTKFLGIEEEFLGRRRRSLR